MPPDTPHKDTRLGPMIETRSSDERNQVSGIRNQVSVGIRISGNEDLIPQPLPSPDS